MSLSQKLSIHNSLHMLKRTFIRQASKHIEWLPNWQLPGIERLYHKNLRTNILLLFYILLLLWPSVMNVSSRLQSHGFIVSRFFYARICLRLLISTEMISISGISIFYKNTYISNTQKGQQFFLSASFIYCNDYRCGFCSSFSTTKSITIR